MKISAVQMISGPAIAPNLETAERLIAEAAHAGAKLVALPEYFPFIGASDSERLRAREMPGRGVLQDFLSQSAKRHQVWLVGGSIPFTAHAQDKLRNTCLIFDPEGKQVGRYDKMHLFSFQKGAESYDESLTIEAGDRPVTVDSPFGKIGLGICYDLRFPELFRAMGQINLLVIPAAFTETTGRDHWEVLLRARAIENQCYVLASAQGGLHPGGRLTHGNSMIIDPWGTVLARLDKGEGCISAEMDLNKLAAVRESLPALRHRIL